VQCQEAGTASNLFEVPLSHSIAEDRIRPQGRQERVLGWLCPVRLACLLSQVSSYNL
jgi:hypothetical protein